MKKKGWGEPRHSTKKRAWARKISPTKVSSVNVLYAYTRDAPGREADYGPNETRRGGLFLSRVLCTHDTWSHRTIVRWESENMLICSLKVTRGARRDLTVNYKIHKNSDETGEAHAREIRETKADRKRPISASFRTRRNRLSRDSFKSSANLLK